MCAPQTDEGKKYAHDFSVWVRKSQPSIFQIQGRLKSDLENMLRSGYCGEKLKDCLLGAKHLTLDPMQKELESSGRGGKKNSVTRQQWMRYFEIQSPFFEIVGKYHLDYEQLDDKQRKIFARIYSGGCVGRAFITRTKRGLSESSVLDAADEVFDELYPKSVSRRRDATRGAAEIAGRCSDAEALVVKPLLYLMHAIECIKEPDRTDGGRPIIPLARMVGSACCGGVRCAKSVRDSIYWLSLVDQACDAVRSHYRLQDDLELDQRVHNAFRDGPRNGMDFPARRTPGSFGCIMNPYQLRALQRGTCAFGQGDGESWMRAYTHGRLGREGSTAWIKDHLGEDCYDMNKLLDLTQQLLRRAIKNNEPLNLKDPLKSPLPVLVK